MQQNLTPMALHAKCTWWWRERNERDGGREEDFRPGTQMYHISCIYVLFVYMYLPHSCITLHPRNACAAMQDIMGVRHRATQCRHGVWLCRNQMAMEGS